LRYTPKKEGKAMLDYMESKLARSEYEERVHAIARINDIDAELNHSAGYWQARPIGALLASGAQWLTAVANRLTHQTALSKQLEHGRDAVVESARPNREQHSVPG
jgi:hypothetical protein